MLAREAWIELRQRDMLGMTEMEIPGEQKQMYTQSPRQTSWKESRRRRKLGREKHAKNDQQLEERPQMSYSESRGKEGTGAGEGKVGMQAGKTWQRYV
jgi:hypothetical protein